MPNILLAWEFGGGLGHIGPLRAIGSALSDLGHSVSLAANQAPLCEQAMPGTGVTVFQAPLIPRAERQLKIPCTYTDLLQNAGYDQSEKVAEAVRGWLLLIDQIKPTVMVVDYSPTAMLAARIRQIPVVVTGTGFVTPTDVTPLPSLHGVVLEPHWAAEVEANVLANMNQVLETNSSAPLERVGQLFSDAASRCLMTLPELDHYSGRSDAKYVRPFGALPGEPIDWHPQLAGPKLFVYLRNDPTTEPLLRGLALKQINTIAYVRELPASLQKTFEGSSVKTTTVAIDWEPLSARCDLVVHNGGHIMVCESLLAGIPQMTIPRSVEQSNTGVQLAKLNVGRTAPFNDLKTIASTLEEMIENCNTFQQAALNYADLMEGLLSLEDFAEEILRVAK